MVQIWRQNICKSSPMTKFVGIFNFLHNFDIFEKMFEEQ